MGSSNSHHSVQGKREHRCPYCESKHNQCDSLLRKTVDSSFSFENKVSCDLTAYESLRNSIRETFGNLRNALVTKENELVARIDLLEQTDKISSDEEKNRKKTLRQNSSNTEQSNHRLSDRQNTTSSVNISTEGEVILTGLSGWPRGLAIDQQNQTVFVADSWKYRIISWIPGEYRIREVVTNLNRPTYVLMDKDNKSLIIADSGNARVIRLSLLSDDPQIETIVDNINCSGLAMDKKGALYITDTSNNSVKRYRKGSDSCEIVAGGNGRGSRLDQLNEPLYVAVNSRETVYVSDHGNHRVVKWRRGARKGVVVVGFGGQGPKCTQLDCPRSVILDHNENLYIADQENDRVIRYRKAKKRTDILLNGLKSPLALGFDTQNRLYVADKSGCVRRFNSIK